MLGTRTRAPHLSSGTSLGGRTAAGLQPPRSAASWRLLWRRLPISFALTSRLGQLRRRLAGSFPSSEDNDPSLIWAAVAAILTPDPDSVLLIRRAERAGDPWGGHMALPGGRRERGDNDLFGTAIRETAEEVGVELDPEHLAGTLEDVVPRTPVLPPIAVRPFVFTVPTRPALKLSSEVATARWVTIDHLLRPETHHPVHLEVAGQSRVVPAYELEDAIVWGMTERILSGLIRRLG